MNPFLLFGIVVLIILVGIFVRTSDRNVSGHGVRIYIPWGFIGIYISFYIFKEYHRSKRAKREERREYLNQRRQELLHNVTKSKKKEGDVPG